MNLESKLAQLEVANDKLANSYEQSEEVGTAEQFQTVLNEEGKFTYGILNKISQLKVLREKEGRGRCKQMSQC